MSRLPLEIKERALNYRKKGYSLREIIKILGIAQSTASLWSREVRLSNKAKKRLLSKIKKGQYIAAENKKARTASLNFELLNRAKEQISKIKFNKDIGQLICAVIYWCEGCKDDGQVQLTNSDPHLSKLFIDFLETYFNTSRDKFKITLHIHEYHNYQNQLDFWSRNLDIPKSQFYKPYIKPHTGRRIRENYPGCVSIRCYDTMLARRLLAIAKAYLGA